MTPKRIWRRRVKGWRIPPNTVCVTRGRYNKFGNPFREGSNAASVQRFRNALIIEMLAIESGLPAIREDMRYIVTHLHELRGKHLACFCRPGLDCHADVLLDFANRREKRDL